MTMRPKKEQPKDDWLVAVGKSPFLTVYSVGVLKEWYASGLISQFEYYRWRSKARPYNEGVSFGMDLSPPPKKGA